LNAIQPSFIKGDRTGDIGYAMVFNVQNPELGIDTKMCAMCLDHENELFRDLESKLVLCGKKCQSKFYRKGKFVVY